jgi:hypothetical protein
MWSTTVAAVVRPVRLQLSQSGCDAKYFFEHCCHRYP